MSPRTPDHPVDPQFPARWSPRSFAADTLSEAQVMSLLEAARWAPSASNQQPWHFAYALRDDANWQAFSQITNEANRRWCLNGGALIVLLSDRQASAAKHSFDAGCAWGYLALQATHAGYHAHGMGGINREKAVEVLGIPEGFRVEAAVAIGKIAAKETLPEDLMKREVPSGRKKVAEFISEGRFTAP